MSESKGLGDTIAKITHALGIDKVAETVAHALGQEDCGCGKRQEALNQMFPYKTPDPIPTPLDVNAYEFEGTRTFEILQPLIAHKDGQQIMYDPTTQVEVDNEHPLYPYLKHLLQYNRIKPV